MIKKIKTDADLSEASLEYVFIQLEVPQYSLCTLKVSSSDALHSGFVSRSFNKSMNIQGFYVHPLVDPSFDEGYWELHYLDNVIYSPGA